MKRKSIVVPGLHHGGQPIPVASVVGNTLVSGGIMGMDPETGVIPGDVKQQCKIMFENVSRIMNAAEGNLEDIVRFTVFLKDKENRSVVNEEWLKYFPDEVSRPSRMTVNRDDLPNPLLIQCEIHAIL
jgi:2-iminobutanoate/2-iminopropanoate deaminase